MCWEVKVGIVVTGNLVTRACGDFSDGMYKLLFCCWKPEEVSQETNEDGAYLLGLNHIFVVSNQIFSNRNILEINPKFISSCLTKLFGS